MKVMHVLQSHFYSGAENVACQIIDLFKDEYEMAYTSANGPIAETLKTRGIKFFPLKQLTFFELKRVIDMYQPDVIHAHDVRASILSAYFSKNTKVISHLHGKTFDMGRLSIKSLLYRVNLKKYSKTIVVSKSILDEFYFKNKLKENCLLLGNVVDEKALLNKVEEAPYEDYDFDLIYVGRLVYAKNPHRLIEIIKRVNQLLPSLKIGIVGDGELRQEVEDIAKKSKITNLEFVGYKSNPYKILSKSKVMIMTSRMEGTPMVLLESMLLKVPVVSTPIDGIKEIVANGEDGFYTDNDDEMVEIIVALLSNEVLRSQIAKNVYNKALIINNMSNYANKLRAVYEN
ncbi:glycosyltransferase [Paenibacillus methanolicus]|uniref:Glycosyltransferase involved in cell wall biosynthesis n=1 Tax=Paenibacillus methanolicus TaxID=582686 RepID=A0A5S5C8D5_9BACL|nr:glycosyltransferase [Paenibacillus methanolicus]TYP75665.1 glycosyltransferase involved in cell wall biosynthesis [Paenibacillus methanolicus]